MKAVSSVFTSLLILLLVFGCSQDKNGGEKTFFLDLGQFTVESLGSNIKVVQDGAGRRLILVPRGQSVPEGYEGMEVVRIPVKRVVAYRFFDVAVLKALGSLDTLVAVTIPKKDWYLTEIRDGMDQGRITYIGRPDAIDYERLKRLRPDLVLTWDIAALPMLKSLGIHAVVTTTPVAMCLSTRMKFVEFLAPFLGKEGEAKEFIKRVKRALDDIREKTSSHTLFRPKVMWGDIYEKRVLVEPGNSWIGQLIGLVNSDYLFEDVYGASCIEINLERFLYSGRDADIYFTYRTPATGATSKDALKAINPLISTIRPLQPGGRVYSPRPEFVQQQDRLDEIFTEIAAILHPDLYPGYRLKFFLRLPEHDPPAGDNPDGRRP